jgi:hypothetical protein
MEQELDLNNDNKDLEKKNLIRKSIVHNKKIAEPVRNVPSKRNIVRASYSDYGSELEFMGDNRNEKF